MSENTKTGGNSEKSGKAKPKRMGNIFAKWYREYKAELKKIVWPTLKQTQKNTTIVIVIVIIVAAFIYLLDLVFGTGYTQLMSLL